MTRQRTAKPRSQTRARSDEAKREVRQALIDAGRELISHEGAVPVSLRQIARHAQYSPGVVYRYFPDKAALMQAIRDEALDSLADRIEGLLSTDGDAREMLLMIAEAGFRFATEQSANFGMNILTMSWNRTTEVPDPFEAKMDLSSPGARIHQLYERAILRFIEQAGAKPPPLDMAVASFMATITGSVALPGGSLHGALPERTAVLQENISMLMQKWEVASLRG